MKIGTTELLIVLAVVIVLFGPTQIPKLSKMVGNAIKGFRESIADGPDDKESTHKESAHGEEKN